MVGIFGNYGVHDRVFSSGTYRLTGRTATLSESSFKANSVRCVGHGVFVHLRGLGT